MDGESDLTPYEEDMLAKSLEIRHLYIVLDESLEKLAILGVIPFTYAGMAEALEKEELEEEENRLEEEEEQERKRVDTTDSLVLELACEKLRKRTPQSRSLDFLFRLISSRIVQEELLFPHYRVKVEKDRRYLQGILVSTKEEMYDKGSSFDSLKDTIEREKSLKAEQKRSLEKADESEKLLLKLSRECLKVRQEQIQCNRNLDEIIDCLNSKLQKKRHENSLNANYELKICNVQVKKKLKEINKSFGDMASELRQLKTDISDERRAAQSIGDFLHKTQDHLEERLEHWMDRYERDVETGVKKLEALKVHRSQNWDRILNMLREYDHCENVVNKRHREQAKLKVVQEGEQHSGSTAV